jgi:trk system potassium uptake protein TrkA
MDWVHIVIVGCGRVGSGLGVGLSEQGHSVSIIDRSPKAFRRLPAEWTGTTVIGSGFDRDDLDRAGAREATALAAVTSGDNSNILTARIARETYEIPNVVARIYDPRRAQIYLRLGIPTVATVSWTIDQVRRRLVPGEVESEWTDSTGTLSLVERELPERWAGKRLADVSVSGDMTVVAVTRAGVARLDFTELVGQDGDVLHVMVSDKALDRMNLRLARTAGEHAGQSGHGAVGTQAEPVSDGTDPAHPAGKGIDGPPEPGPPDASSTTGGAVAGGRP